MSPPRMGAPTYATRERAWSRHGLQPLGSGVDQPKTISSRENAMINRLTAHTDQASHEAARELIPPTPRSCSLVPSVTTPLYRTIVAQALRQPLRESSIG